MRSGSLSASGSGSGSGLAPPPPKILSNLSLRAACSSIIWISSNCDSGLSFAGADSGSGLSFSGSGTGSVLNRPFLGSAYGSLSGSPSGSGSGEEPSALRVHGPTSFSGVPKYFRCSSSLTILGTMHHHGSMRKLKMDLGSLLAKGAGAGTIRQRNTVEQSISRSILKLEKLEDLHDRLLLCDRDPSL